MNLDELRKQIDVLDERLIELLNKRTQLAIQIGKLKKQDEAEVYVPSREKMLLDRLFRINQGPLSSLSLRAIYREIMSASLALEHDVKVAYLGPPSSFAQQAACERFGSSVCYLEGTTIDELFDMVEGRKADYGVVPVGNFIAASTMFTLEKFTWSKLKICAEMYFPLAVYFMTHPNAVSPVRLYSTSRVYKQCRTWLDQHMSGVERCTVDNVVEAAERASEEEKAAALASALAAKRFGLVIRHGEIEQELRYVARFIVLGKAYGGPTGRDKTSMLFMVEEGTGALWSAIEPFNQFGIHITRLESKRYGMSRSGTLFFVEVEGHTANEPLRRALKEIESRRIEVYILGSYPAADELG